MSVNESEIAATNSGGQEPDARKTSPAVVKRLSLYSRVLQAMEFDGQDKVSSADLARRLGLNSSQVRKDLAIFGQFGVPGFGYPVMELRREIRRILGTDREVRVILIGVGNLGSALMSYRGFLKQGFTMLWGFDADPVAAAQRVRTRIPIFHVDDLEQQIASRPVDIAVLAVPQEAAQGITDRLVALGVMAILNFTPARIQVPAGVHVRYVDLSLELESLSFYVQ
ncbi:redox-sensing transcriptional repressor Rex [bacterium]|nr:redox-sensing transcriptional repressor Rex [bacterium]